MHLESARVHSLSLCVHFRSRWVEILMCVCRVICKALSSVHSHGIFLFFFGQFESFSRSLLFWAFHCLSRLLVHKFVNSAFLPSFLVRKTPKSSVRPIKKWNGVIPIRSAVLRVRGTCTASWIEHPRRRGLAAEQDGGRGFARWRSGCASLGLQLDVINRRQR